LADEAGDLSALPIALQLRFVFKPIQLQTLAERHTRTVQHHPQVILSNSRRLADLRCIHFLHFTQHERGAYAR